MSLIPTSRRALRHLAHWRSLGLPQIRVGVNLSSAELRRKDFAGHFLDAARLARIGSRIDVEISESTLLGDRADLHETLQKLRSEGVRVTLDDFGMVRPSLQCLAQFPADRRRSWGLIPRAQVQIPPLKIDRSFVQSLSRQPQSQAVVSTILAVARACALRTVAEGVATMEQLEILDTLGCGESQGYLHSPAVPADSVTLESGLQAAGARSPRPTPPGARPSPASVAAGRILDRRGCTVVLRG